jgi:uncharacterized membrane protein
MNGKRDAFTWLHMCMPYVFMSGVWVTPVTVWFHICMPYVLVSGVWVTPVICIGVQCLGHTVTVWFHICMPYVLVSDYGEREKNSKKMQ